MKKLTNSKIKETKNKAFTLIELLAVIVILAIVALIATPIILNILYKVRKSAFQDSAYGILASGKMYYADMVLNDNVTEQTFFFDGENRPNLEYAGEIPKGGVLQISADGEISLALHNNEWCAVKGKDEENIRMIKYKSGKCIIPDGNNKPMITLNGDRTIYIEINGSYNEQGAIARTSAGEELEYTTVIKLNDTVVTSIDTSVEATYKIIYTVTSETENTISETRTVVVTTDTVEPTLAVENYDGKVGDNVELSSKYTANFGEKGGSVTCKYGSTEITNVSYFKEEGTYTVSCIAHGLNGKSSGIKTMTITLKDSTMSVEELVKDNPEVMTNDPDENPRFVGANPKNYVSFNGELYRIIGVFDGQMKIIYWGDGEPYLQGVAWDTTNSNDWSRPSTLNTTLNSTYWESLDARAQEMVDQSHVWNIGGITAESHTRVDYYRSELDKTWTGKVGLVTPADYGYASKRCDDSLNIYQYTTTKGENWLYRNKMWWTMIAAKGTKTSMHMIATDGALWVDSSNITYAAVGPVLYLVPEVKITGGEGTSGTPYSLGL